MKAKYTVWVAFFLNLSYAIVEFIAGGIFGSSAVLADSVHDLGDAIAIGCCDSYHRIHPSDFGKYN